MEDLNNIDNEQSSELRQWPVHLHLVNPDAPFFKNSELSIIAICAPIASANIHKNYIKGHSVVIACPKLDYSAPYTEKLAEIFAVANIKKVTVAQMVVPCCQKLSKFAIEARKISGRDDLVIEEHLIGLDGKFVQMVNI